MKRCMYKTFCNNTQNLQNGVYKLLAFFFGCLSVIVKRTISTKSLVAF